MSMANSFWYSKGMKPDFSKIAKSRVRNPCLSSEAVESLISNIHRQSVLKFPKDARNCLVQSQFSGQIIA